jgi:integrase
MTSAVPLPTVPGQEYGHTLDTEISDGGDVFGGRDHTETWAEAIDGWTASLKVSKTATTIRQRRWQLRTLAELHQHRSPWKLSLGDLEQWLTDKDWSAETRKSARSAVRSFYAWGVKNKHIRRDRNPAVDLDSIPVARRLPRPAKETTITAALDGADDRLRLMLLLAAKGGLRVSEIASLRWDAIDGNWMLVRGKKDRERRFVMPADLRDALAEEHARRATGHLGSGFCYGIGDPAVWVFPGKRGGMNPAWISEILSRALGGTTTAHQLRHRAATLGLQETGNLAAVQDFLGHSKPETTRNYAGVDERAMQALADAL